MQDAQLVKIESLSPENLSKIEDLYKDFSSKSYTEYRFEHEPLPFDIFTDVIKEGAIKGYLLEENSDIKGFLLYVEEEHKAIELNLVYFKDTENEMQRFNTLVGKFLNDLKSRDDWNVISYPMLGYQDRHVRLTGHLGFKLLGQAVVKFKLDNLFTYKIFTNLTLPDLPSGYTIDVWQDEYLDSASEVINESFKNASDAKFDPRFLSLEGSKDIVSKIVTGLFGTFLPDCTHVLKYQGNVVGVCFANVASVRLANVPLIGIKADHKGKKLGEYLLYMTIAAVIQHIKEGLLPMNEVNAAVETDNFAALKMYRKIGFREDYTYPHAYYKNPNFKN